MGVRRVIVFLERVHEFVAARILVMHLGEESRPGRYRSHVGF